MRVPPPATPACGLAHTHAIKTRKTRSNPKNHTCRHCRWRHASMHARSNPKNHTCRHCRWRGGMLACKKPSPRMGVPGHMPALLVVFSNISLTQVVFYVKNSAGHGKLTSHDSEHERSWGRVGRASAKTGATSFSDTSQSTPSCFCPKT
jgi:hypothetical protein